MLFFKRIMRVTACAGMQQHGHNSEHHFSNHCKMLSVEVKTLWMLPDLSHKMTVINHSLLSAYKQRDK